MALTPTEAEMIADAIESALIDVHVGLPGKIQSYDADAQTATVELQVKRVLPKADGGFATEDLPVLENVPVQFPRSKAFALTFPLAEGDFGQVVFNEMSIDQWRSKGDVTSPGDIGRHTLSGGVFQPGLYPNDDALADAAHATNLVVGLDGGIQIHVTPGGEILLGSDSASEAVVLGDAFKTNYDAHTHGSPFGPTGPPVAPMTELSATVKAE